jgi:hypothetical protein
MKLIKCFILFSIFFSGYSCANDLENDLDNFSSEPGKTPQSIEQIIDVFELKYGEVKEQNINGAVFKFSIVDIVDSLQVCSETAYQHTETFKINVYLRIEKGNDILLLKVSSRPCATPIFLQDFGINTVQNALDEWQKEQVEQNNYQFRFSFGLNFSTGTMIKKTPYSIYIGQAYSKMFHQQTDKNIYKFIFIITN